MKNSKTQPTSLKVNSFSFLKALKVKVAKSSSDQFSKLGQRNSSKVDSEKVTKLGMA